MKKNIIYGLGILLLTSCQSNASNSIEKSEEKQEVAASVEEVVEPTKEEAVEQAQDEKWSDFWTEFKNAVMNDDFKKLKSWWYEPLLFPPDDGDFSLVFEGTERLKVDKVTPSDIRKSANNVYPQIKNSKNTMEVDVKESNYRLYFTIVDGKYKLVEIFTF